VAVGFVRSMDVSPHCPSLGEKKGGGAQETRCQRSVETKRDEERREEERRTNSKVPDVSIDESCFNPCVRKEKRFREGNPPREQENATNLDPSCLSDSSLFLDSLPSTCELERADLEASRASDPSERSRSSSDPLRREFSFRRIWPFDLKSRREAEETKEETRWLSTLVRLWTCFRLWRWGVDEPEE